jgi:hypothetical protein
LALNLRRAAQAEPNHCPFAPRSATASSHSDPLSIYEKNADLRQSKGRFNLSCSHAHAMIGNFLCQSYKDRYQKNVSLAGAFNFGPGLTTCTVRVGDYTTVRKVYFSSGAPLRAHSMVLRLDILSTTPVPPAFSAVLHGLQDAVAQVLGPGCRVTLVCRRRHEFDLLFPQRQREQRRSM